MHTILKKVTKYRLEELNVNRWVDNQVEFFWSTVKKKFVKVIELRKLAWRNKRFKFMKKA